MPRRQVNAKAAIEDIRAGMNDKALMEKYEITEWQLASLFQKLLERGLLQQADVDKRRLGSQESLDIVWTCPACHMPQPRAYDQCPQCGVTVVNSDKPEQKESGEKAGEAQKFERHSMAEETKIPFSGEYLRKNKMGLIVLGLVVVLFVLTVIILLSRHDDPLKREAGDKAIDYIKANVKLEEEASKYLELEVVRNELGHADKTIQGRYNPKCVICLTVEGKRYRAKEYTRVFDKRTNPNTVYYPQGNLLDVYHIIAVVLQSGRMEFLTYVGAGISVGPHGNCYGPHSYHGGTDMLLVDGKYEFGVWDRTCPYEVKCPEGK